MCFFIIVTRFHELRKQSDKALALYDHMSLVVKDSAAARASIPELLSKLNLRLWLNFAEAKKRVAKALLATKPVRLGLNDLKYLNRLPDEIRNASAVQILDLRGTHVSDIRPLAALSSLHRLELSSTLVQDLTPVAHLPRKG